MRRVRTGGRTTQGRLKRATCTESRSILTFWRTTTSRENYRKCWMTAARSKLLAARANVPRKRQWETSKWKGVLRFASSCRRRRPTTTSLTIKCTIRTKSISPRTSKARSSEFNSRSSNLNLGLPVRLGTSRILLLTQLNIINRVQKIEWLPNLNHNFDRLWAHSLTQTKFKKMKLVSLRTKTQSQWTNWKTRLKAKNQQFWVQKWAKSWKRFRTRGQTSPII